MLPRLLYLLPAPVLLLFAGCGGSTNLTVTPPPPVVANPGASFSGKVMAGTQPLAGATVQLYAAGTAGNRSPATSLLSGALTTDSTGSFTVPSGYACPTITSQLYVVARGGALAGGSNNSAIALLATLGACNQVTTSQRVVLNELTTVANVWALSQFFGPGDHIGASASNTVGFANAVATAANFVNPATGIAPGATFPANGVAPTARLNSLANLLNTCVVATSSSTACTKLLGSSLIATQDTLYAALDIVASPGTNVAALYNQSTASKAFSPALAAAPADWTLFVSYTGGGMDMPSGLGIDSKGNVWVSSYYSAGNSNPSAGSVTEFSPVGLSLFPSGITGYGLNSIYGLAIDSSDNVWIPNEQSDYSVNQGQGSVTELNSSGQVMSGATGYVGGGLANPISIAIDPDGSVWVVDNWKTRVSKLSSTGQAISGTSGFQASSLSYPISIAVDANHNAWIGDQLDGVVTEVSSNGSKTTAYSCCNEPAGLAIDQSGNVWAANFAVGNLTQMSSSGSVVSGSGYTSNGVLVGAQGIAIDGAGNAWLSGIYSSPLVEFAGSTAANPGKVLSPANGLAPDAGKQGAFAMAIDASGNVWVTNFYANSITEYIGLAAPVKTPLIGPAQAP